MSKDTDRYFDPSELNDDASSKCPYCHGTGNGNDGYGLNYYPCPDCNGAGYNEESNEEAESI